MGATLGCFGFFVIRGLAQATRVDPNQDVPVRDAWFGAPSPRATGGGGFWPSPRGAESRKPPGRPTRQEGHTERQSPHCQSSKKKTDGYRRHPGGAHGLGRGRPAHKDAGKRSKRGHVFDRRTAERGGKTAGSKMEAVDHAGSRSYSPMPTADYFAVVAALSRLAGFIEELLQGAQGGPAALSSRRPARAKAACSNAPRRFSRRRSHGALLPCLAVPVPA